MGGNTIQYVLQAPWARLTNRVLGDYPEAMRQLAAHAGKIVRIRSGLFDLRLLIASDGAVEVAADGVEPQLEIVAPPHLLPQLAARDEAALRQVTFDGDAELAEVMGHLARHLEWDIEADLSRVTGDIVAHRVVGAARDMRDWSKEARERLGANIREYLTEETAALVSRRDLQEFLHDVDTLRDDVARLEQRLAQRKTTGKD